MNKKESKRGILYALSAYVFWGLHPIYWKQLEYIDALEILANRIFWSLLFFVIVISFRQGWPEFMRKIGSSNSVWKFILPAFLIGSNWGVYIWAVNAGFIIETSLGYFISPLVSVFLGVYILGEKLDRIQQAAIGIAVAAVLIMTIIYGQFPWISLFLATTWGLYGLLRKKSPLTAIEGLLLETFVLALPAIAFLSYLIHTESFSFFQDINTGVLLTGTGIISGLPLIIFISGAKIIKLSLIGVLQYIYPTLIFLIGYFIYDEPMDQAKIIGFILIWIALFLYTFGGNLKSRSE